MLAESDDTSFLAGITLSFWEQKKRLATANLSRVWLRLLGSNQRPND